MSSCTITGTMEIIMTSTYDRETEELCYVWQDLEPNTIYKITGYGSIPLGLTDRSRLGVDCDRLSQLTLNSKIKVWVSNTLEEMITFKHKYIKVEPSIIDENGITQHRFSLF